jgi:ADP-heptose:LPS heptosyltransferase
VVVGSASHRLRANEIVRAYPATRVRNLAGRQSWAEMVRTVRGAACVVVNNSGVAHLAAHFGVPTVEIFAGTHQRREWRARGDSVILLSRAIGCSPCQLDHGQTSPYDKACLRQITPEMVADAMDRAMALAGRRVAA